RVGDLGELALEHLALGFRGRFAVSTEDGHRHVAGIAVADHEPHRVGELGVPAGRAGELTELAAGHHRSLESHRPGGTRGARALSRFTAGIFGERRSKVDRPSAAVYRPTMGDARTRFTAIVAPTVTRIPLAEAALWIAAEEYPELDVEAYIDRL